MRKRIEINMSSTRHAEKVNGLCMDELHIEMMSIVWPQKHAVMRYGISYILIEMGEIFLIENP